MKTVNVTLRIDDELKAQAEDPKAKGIKSIFAAIVADEGEETPDEQ